MNILNSGQIPRQNRHGLPILLKQKVRVVRIYYGDSNIISANHAYIISRASRIKRF